MRILRRAAALFVGIAMSSASAELHSKNIRKVWEINLSQYLKERPAMAKPGSHYVSSVRFSDDEGLIAVAAGEHSSGGEYWSHVAIFQTQRPQERPLQFDYPGLSAPRMAWSSDSQTLALDSVPRRVIRITDGRTCEMSAGPPFLTLGGFLRDRIVVAEVFERRNRIVVTSKLVFYDLNCVEARSMVIQGRIESVDTTENPDRIALTNDEGGKVIDAQSGETINSWQMQPAAEVMFVDNGRAVCLSIDRSKSDPSWCRAIEGTIKDATPKLKGGFPFSTARKGTWVAAADSKYSYFGLTETAKWDFRKTVIYDYRTAKTIGFVGPSFQELRFVDKPTKLPFKFALSPSGRFLAEAGADILRLYEINPD